MTPPSTIPPKPPLRAGGLSGAVRDGADLAADSLVVAAGFAGLADAGASFGESEFTGSGVVAPGFAGASLSEPVFSASDLAPSVFGAVAGMFVLPLSFDAAPGLAGSFAVPLEDGAAAAAFDVFLPSGARASAEASDGLPAGLAPGLDGASPGFEDAPPGSLLPAPGAAVSGLAAPSSGFDSPFAGFFLSATF
ncbi:hypothetical protein D6850_01710 [Roseovarius spongiae]|uniref:Uncharacterized protein n=1 Tax=Roseovarius spongiae TaxID=2320272 RepID=A0A3A8BAQ5_9RHOB|nr:hypothetical protein D6850_01710 [Roseovarius spongiae]